MKCPVCGNDCVQKAHEIIDTLSDVFSPCNECHGRTLDKNSPLSDGFFVKPCRCGKRFIDEVYAHIYSIFIEEGNLTSSDALKKVGYPLIHPGFAMTSAPYLPQNSLVLLSPVVSKSTADRTLDEVPEVRGLVKCGQFTPGGIDVDFMKIPRTYELLAGCDVRADIFYTQTHPVVVYKQQSRLHIEFPRGYDPKIISVGVNIRRSKPKVFIDACCGAGTLGIFGGMLGVPRIILNDAWYAAAFWAAYNLKVNSEFLLVNEVKMLKEYRDMESHPIIREPEKVAMVDGDQHLEVYQGDFRLLHKVIPKESSILAVIDLFEKGDNELNHRIEREWIDLVGGEVFIP